METHIVEAEKKTEEIETSVGKCVNDAENLRREVDDLVQRKGTDMKAMGKFEGNTHQPYSRLDSLPGIQYQAASEDFIYFGSRQKAYDELFKALNDDSIHMIGLYGENGSGKTTLVTEVGKQAEDRKIFDKVISITVSKTPNIRDIQEELADMLHLELKENSKSVRAQRLWLHLHEKNRILIIVDDLWTNFDLKMIGIGLDDVNKHTWKILITTPHELVCTLKKCQKKIHLELLSEDESWNLFQKFAGIDDQRSTVLNDVPRQICNECTGLPLAIKIVGSLFNEYTELMASKASNDEDDATLCTKLSYDHLTQEAKQIFLLCALFPEEYHILIEDLVRYVVGLGVSKRSSLKSMRKSTSTVIKEILAHCLAAPGSVKMHNMVRDAALWIANRSDKCKILVNVDKPLSTVAEDNNIKDCFALSSWWFNENPSFCQLHAPNLKMLLVNISAHSSLNSLDLSPLTFEGIQGLEVFSLTIKYKKVPLLFPQSIQLLKNVRTLRLNGLKLGDISFIGSLISLEVLDFRSCRFKELPIEIGKLMSLKLLDLSECNIYGDNYKGEIGKCSQLEELYASKCYPLGYVHEIILDIGILLNLQRFVFGEPIIPESTRALQVYDFNISKLTASNKNILQIAETISLSLLRGGCKSIVPDMVGIVGGMNSLSTLHLKCCKEIECIFDTTYDLKEDDLIPMLVELRLTSMDNLTELCHGPPQQVLHYFERLELLYIDVCWNLHIIFPSECKLQNLKILCLSYCKTDEVLFSESVAQSLQQLEQVTIEGCDELKHIIASSRSDHGGCNTSEEIVPAPMNSHFFMSKLRNIDILNCKSLESIFPICYVEGLVQLQNMSIEKAPKLEYVFGKCDHKNHSSHHVMLPHLKTLNLISLYNLIGMYPENCQAKWPSHSPRTINIQGCSKLAILWFNLNEIWSLQCLQSLTLADCEELKCLFSMETHTSLPELMYLSVSNCQELEQIVAANEELVELPKAELYFPKLKEIKVENCKKLKSLFPLSVAQSLQQLEQLKIHDCSDLKHIIAASGSETGGCNTKSLRILHITGCPKLAIPWFNLKVGYDQRQYHMNEIWSLQCLQSLTLSDCEELKCLFSMEIHRSLPELMYLQVFYCQELEQIVAANEELAQLANGELYFPKLKEIKVRSCNKLKSLFPLSMVTMLPQLSTLHLSKATQLQEVFTHSQGDGVMNELEVVLPNLTEITLAGLPNFVDICHGCKLHAVKLQKLSISNCRKTASSLRIIEKVLTEERDTMNNRIKEAEKKTEEIETSVGKCVNDVENLPREEDDLVQKKETDMKTVGKFIGNIQPYSRLDSLPGIQYQAAVASKDFIYFGSRQKAYDELFKALNDDSVHMIGLYGEGGCGKTTLVTEVGKQAVDRKMFDKVISITMSQTPDIRAIQGNIADMLNLRLWEESPNGRAQRLWLHLQEKKRILIIVDDLWKNFDLKMIGIRLDDVNKHTWKILITTRHKLVCTSMKCQKKIHLELLSDYESWNLFQKFAGIDDQRSTVLKDVPRQICKEFTGLPLAIKIVGSLFNERKEIEWLQAYENLMASKASDDEENATRLKLSYDHLPTQRAKQIFLLCALFPAEKHTPTEDLVRYAAGLDGVEISSLQSMRSSISAVIKDLLDSCLLARG